MSKPVWSPAHKARVTKLVEEWAAVLFLGDHHIDLIFAEKDSDVTFYPRLLEIKERRMQSRAVLHELSHLLTGTLKHLLWKIIVKEQMMMWHEVKDHDERLTDWFANVVFKLSGK